MSMLTNLFYKIDRIEVAESLERDSCQAWVVFPVLMILLVKLLAYSDTHLCNTTQVVILPDKQVIVYHNCHP